MPSDACTTGELATHAPTATATMVNPSPAASHQYRARHTATGNPTRKNVRNSRHIGACEPVTRARAWATSWVSLPTRAGSGAALRTMDRWVAVRW